MIIRTIAFFIFQFFRDLKKTFDRLDNKKAFDLNDYNSLEDIDQYLQQQINNCPSGANCEIEIIGTTYEGRNIRLFKVSCSIQLVY